MFDTISLYQKGIPGADFEINEKMFKSKINEEKEVIEQFNVFYSNPREKKRQAIFIKNDLQQNYLTLTFSIPKLLYGTSLKDFDLKDSEELITVLGKRTKDIIGADFENMQVSRLDITRNVNLELDTSFYLQSLKENITSSKRYKIDLFDTSLVIKNSSRRFTIYDKIIEQIKSKEITRSESKPYGNVLRFEAQHKKAQHIKTSLKNVNPLLLSDLLTQGMYTNCNQFLVKSYNDFFMHSGQTKIFDSELYLVNLICDRYKRNRVTNFVIKQYAELQNSRGLSIDFYHIEKLFKSQMSRIGISKAIKQIKELVNLNGITVNDTINEIYLKLCA